MSDIVRMPIRSDIAWSTTDRIGVLGYDLARDLIGKVSLGDMGFLEITGRLPNTRESHMFEAMLVTLVEHGIVPSTLATRMTVTGAPEALQASVAAGLLGLGSVFVGSTEDAAKMLAAAVPDPARPGDLREIAAAIQRERRRIPGIGHPVHKALDPRARKLFAIAKKTGFHGPYVDLMKRVAKARGLPVNATGAVGAICCEMRLPSEACRGIGVMARAVGLVGHALEELRSPMAREIWLRTEEEASSHIRGKLRK
jgi:citrate synthase